MALEQDGIPTVALHTDIFARVARSVARVNGMPTMRQAFVPQPLVGRTAGELRSYIEGPDPIHGRPFAREMLEALTRPLDAADAAGSSFDRSTPRLLRSALNAPTMRAMSGVMCSTIPTRNSIGLIVGPLCTPTSRYSASSM